MKEPKESISYDLNEQKRQLTVKTSYETDDLVSNTTNVYSGDEAIKRFLKYNVDQKKRAKETIEQTEKMISTLKDKESTERKGLKNLTKDQKELIEDLRIIGTYQELDKIQQQKKSQEDYLQKAKKGMKKDNEYFEKLKQACKSVDFKFD